MYAPVREARRLWHERYAEQLCLTAEDIAPWLIELQGTTAPTLAAHGSFPGTVSEFPAATPVNQPNNNGHRPHSPEGKRAAGGRQEKYDS
jgi:hypothetical protein